MKISIKITAVLLLSTAVSLAAAGMADSVENVLHPQFFLKNAQGGIITDKKQKISNEKSCMPCHDAKYIMAHSSHYKDKMNPSCVECHFKDGEMSGDYRKVNVLVQRPDNTNCGKCHGIIDMCREGLRIPDDYTRSLDYLLDGRRYDFTQGGGTVYAPQNIADSDMNIKNKFMFNYPWDVHSLRQLECVDCHFNSNDPRFCGTVTGDLDHLTRDPRKIKSTGKYLKWPDHRLAAASCECCHDPYVIHEHLPYKQRHMDTLNCTACHIPNVKGPGFQSLDETVVTEKGEARIEFRGYARDNDYTYDMNTMYLEGYSPGLFSYKVDKKKQQRVPKYVERKISPFNLVTRWFWKEKDSGKEVSLDVVRKACLEGKKYSPGLTAFFDADKNGTIDGKELVLDKKEKVAFMASRLEKLGVKNPVIVGVITPHRLNHGLVHEKQAVRRCNECHDTRARLGDDIVLASHAPAGIMPRLASDAPVTLNGEIESDGGDGYILVRNTGVKYSYVFGHGRRLWLDLLGFWIFVLSALGVAGHSVLRYRAAKKIQAHAAVMERVYMYGFYERLWHWTMAAGVLILIVTGFEIHYSGSVTILGLENAVVIHNVLAFIIVANAFLSLFYHITTGEIKQFFSVNRIFLKEATVQTLYYIHGIFRGEAHPMAKTRDRKLNPLQQITYVGLLNILLPFQVITGILIWSAGYWPSWGSMLGGLTIIAPLHNLGSWMILTFLVVHVYLTTTGHTVLANIKAMVTGFDDVEIIEESQQVRTMLGMKLKDLVKAVIDTVMKKDRT
jgi:thiosulfate reductase cytochrome b subunit